MSDAVAVPEVEPESPGPMPNVTEVVAPSRTAPEHDGPERASAADEGDPEIAPDSLRVDAAGVGEELFGDLYTDISAHGPTAFGNHNIINNFAAPPLKPIVAPLTHVSDLLACYAGSDSDGKLDEILAARSTACLAGPKNSGRFSTACAALARRYGANGIYEISLPAGVQPEALLEHAGLVRKERGHVLRLPADGRAEVVRRLAGLFHRRSASLLLIRDDGGRERGKDFMEVHHRQPDPIMVFRKHLGRRLRVHHGLSADESAKMVDHYLTRKGVRGELKQTYAPQEAVAMAQAIAERHPVDDAGMKAILAECQPGRRSRALKILLPPEGGVPVPGRRAGQHERAFRIAYAVFRRRPMHYVFESAAWLLNEIDDAALRPEWGHMALQHPVQDLLGEELRKDWLAGRDVVNSSSGTSRSAWIRDAGLRGAILDVAWHDFDSTRGSLLAWLDRLVREGDEIMTRAAAETAALLAHHDFDRMHRKLIDEWASSPSSRIRQAAAWTETIADLGGDVGHLVREKLRDWCYGTSNYRRDTAARVYASGLQQRVLAWSMSDLRRIAADRLQRREPAVAEAVNQLYKPDTASWLITELAHWTDSPEVCVHAGRALLAMAVRPNHDFADGRPDLLVRLATGMVDSVALAKVWQVALVEPALSPSAWPLFARWLRHADVEVGLRSAAVNLVRLLMDSRHMRRRMEFFLTRAHNFEGGVPLWVRQLLGDR